MYLDASEAASPSLRRDLRLNAAVALQKAGKHEEAAAIFEELAGAGGEGDAAAATGLGIARFRAAESVTNDAPEQTVDREALLAQAAEAFRAAARTAKPGDKGPPHDLELTARRWIKAHDEAAVARVLTEIGKSQPPEIAERVMREQRALAAACAAALTNEAPARLSRCETLAERQRHNALLLLPFKDRFLEAARQAAGTNDIANQIRQVDQFIEATRSVMSGSAEYLRDADSQASASTRSAAGGAMRLWKLVAPFSSLLTQDILLQTNTIAMTDGRAAIGPVLDDESALTFQEDAMQITGLFSNRFEAAVPPEGLPGQASTNSPAPGANPATEGGISPENRAKVLELSASAEREQSAALGRFRAGDPAGSLPRQREAHRLLVEIAALLPKQPQSSQQEQQDQNSQQQKKESSNPQQDQPKTNETSSAQQPQPPEPREAQTNQTESASATNTPAVPQDVQAMMEKALMREREHDTDLKRRNQRIPMQPGARDW